jgi:hypothetical protein
MSEFFAEYSSTVSTIATHHTIMAIAKMGHQHSGAQEIFLAEHNMPFWSAQKDNSR